MIISMAAIGIELVAAQPNSSLNRSGISLSFILKIEGLVRFFPPG
jgi:hypothetical protein